MDQLFVAPTFLAAVTHVTAIRSGYYGTDGRRVLLTTNNGATPEVSGSLAATPGFAALGRHFDQIVHLNELIYPHHPFAWRSGSPDAIAVRDRILDETGLARDVGITLQSAAVPPSSTLTKLFDRSAVTVISDGLMSYGPSRRRLASSVSERLATLLYLDLVPGLEPLLFHEHGIAHHVLPNATFRAVVEEFATEHPSHEALADLSGGVDVIIVGQYLSQLGLLTVEDELELYQRMVEAAALLGHQRLLFKPHPSAPGAFTESLLQGAQVHGAQVQVLELPVPVEALYAIARPQLIIGSFSTALATAVAFDIDAASVGTDLMSTQLSSYRDSNRVPLALTAATRPRVVLDGARATIAPPIEVEPALLLRALAGTMHPKRFPALNAETQDFVATAKLDPDLSSFFQAPDGDATSSWVRAGMPTSVGRLIPDSWFAPIWRFSRRRLSGLVRVMSRHRKAAGITVPPLTVEDFARRL